MTISIQLYQEKSIPQKVDPSKYTNEASIHILSSLVQLYSKFSPLLSQHISMRFYKQLETDLSITELVSKYNETDDLHKPQVKAVRLNSHQNHGPL